MSGGYTLTMERKRAYSANNQYKREQMKQNAKTQYHWYNTMQNRQQTAGTRAVGSMHRRQWEVKQRGVGRGGVDAKQVRKCAEGKRGSSREQKRRDRVCREGRQAEGAR